ncbi:MAG: bifunctional oligoribonuclease/PAP phosphatase NrnA [Bacteroidales bacterium]|nr:bifunctional oligoribonuclease/PAP phosphatase NrnA [Bacteroidales bacterium]MCF8391673.1 bifunctional oligoribonuclease/PAP phosphatase NrnA [Bacteroidales bacterium]
MNLSKYPLKSLRERIEQAENILVTTHVNPDGDAIGASLALVNVFKSLKKKVSVISPNELPDYLTWMKSAGEIINFELKPDIAKSVIKNADLIFYVDFNGIDRLAKAADYFQNSTAYKIVIDHHPNPESMADLTISEPGIGSAAELVFEFVKQIGFSDVLDKDIAECIFTGIMTDTGNFSFSCAYPGVWNNMAELLSYEIDRDRVFSEVYDNYSENRMRLMGYCLNDKMKIIPEINSAVICLTIKEMDRYGFKMGDTEGFVNMPFSISGLKFSVLMLEKDDHVKLSLRSKGSFDVNLLARKHFSGGGHKNAAGGEMPLPIETAEVKMIEILKEYNAELG